LIYSRVNVLVLDEPTNHLDIPSREALEEALDAYEGTILTISHDRYFLDRVATQMLALDGQGAAEHYDGDYTEYHDWRANRLTPGAASKASSNAAALNLVRAEPLTPMPPSEEAGSQVPGGVRQPSKGKKDGTRGPSASSGVKVIKKKKVDVRTPERLEADIAQAEKRLKEISEQMGVPEIARDASRLIQLNEEYQEADVRLQSLYAEWDRIAADAPK
jgi:ATP-binding cassette, subfamily F, member 3